jgi:hypothetical protein
VRNGDGLRGGIFNVMQLILVKSSGILSKHI